ncbi:MAG: hypothetical protein HC923_13380 [Myxococcales bacterium]|nr:hypothetical protein [Myxococcales bacterium]
MYSRTKLGLAVLLTACQPFQENEEIDASRARILEIDATEAGDLLQNLDAEVRLVPTPEEARIRARSRDVEGVSVRFFGETVRVRYFGSKNNLSLDIDLFELREIRATDVPLLASDGVPGDDFLERITLVNSSLLGGSPPARNNVSRESRVGRDSKTIDLIDSRAGISARHVTATAVRSGLGANAETLVVTLQESTFGGLPTT